MLYAVAHPLYHAVPYTGKQFEKMVEHMASTPIWSLRSWKQVMESQLSSWLMYIPGMKSTANAQELTKMKGVCSSSSSKPLLLY